jgi:two-component system nitrogen regulation sensor histidine kinase NtrY
MIFKSFRLHIIIRLLLLTASIFLLNYSFSSPYLATPFLIIILIVLQVINLIRYVDKINRDVTSFLESIRFAEFTRSFHNPGMGKSFKELNEAFNAVISDFQQVRAEKEEHFHYLQGIVQNIDISIIAYQQNGNIELINRAAKKMFQVAGINNIKELKKVSSELVETLFKIKPGESELVKIVTEEDMYQLTIYATELKVKRARYYYCFHQKYSDRS